MSRKLNIGFMIAMVALFIVTGCANESKDTANSAAAATTADNASSADKASNLTNTANANTPAAKTDEPAYDGPLTSMSFDHMEHDFGQIDQQTENEHVFKFTNTGTEPLVISKAKGSCGCTVPEYPKEPIPPGEDGEIRVVYKPGKQKNKQTKRVTVTANTEPEQTVLKITAEVQELPADAG